MSIQTQIRRINSAVDAQSNTIDDITSILNGKGISASVGSLECGDVCCGEIECGQEKEVPGTPIEKNGIRLLKILEAINSL